MWVFKNLNGQENRVWVCAHYPTTPTVRRHSLVVVKQVNGIALGVV